MSEGNFVEGLCTVRREGGGGGAELTCGRKRVRPLGGWGVEE